MNTNNKHVKIVATLLLGISFGVIIKTLMSKRREEAPKRKIKIIDFTLEVAS